MSSRETKSIWAEEQVVDDELCLDWIGTYVKPDNNIDHMHNSVALWKMMCQDTRSKISHTRFKELMVDSGFLPVNDLEPEWEFRISKSELRKRPSAKVGGWMPSARPDWAFRMW